MPLPLFFHFPFSFLGLRLSWLREFVGSLLIPGNSEKKHWYFKEMALTRVWNICCERAKIRNRSISNHFPILFPIKEASPERKKNLLEFSWWRRASRRWTGWKRGGIGWLGDDKHCRGPSGKRERLKQKWEGRTDSDEYPLGGQVVP